MNHLLRSACRNPLPLIFYLPLPASADLKIKTRTTVAGHTTDSSVSIKGARVSGAR